MKKELTISERGELAQQLVHKDHFYTDLNLYNQKFPGSKLSVQLSKANEHNITGLHNRMLYEMLSKVDHEDILLNRETPEERAARLQAIYVETFIIIDGERRTVLDDDNQLTTVIFTPAEDGAHFGKATDVDGKPAPAFVYEQNGKAYLVTGEEGDYTEVTGEPIAEVIENTEANTEETPIIEFENGSKVEISNSTENTESTGVDNLVVETPVDLPQIGYPDGGFTGEVESPAVEIKSTTEKKVVDKKKGKKPKNSRK